MILMFGVMAPHDDATAWALLEELRAWFEESTEIPLVIRDTKHDCLMSPPERGGKHVEVLWLDCVYSD